MRAFFYQVRYLLETGQTYLLERVSSDGSRQVLPYAQDDPHWIALLSRQKSFRFLGRTGSFSALCEPRRNPDGTQRGEKTYWSAYRKARGAQAKKYLGHDLTTDALERMATALEKHLKAKLGLLDEGSLLMRRSPGLSSPERERVAYLLDQSEKKDRVIADLKQELATRDQMVADLKQQLGTRDQIIAQLRGSHRGQGKRRKPHAR